jgi:hypothetical protein
MLTHNFYKTLLLTTLLSISVSNLALAQESSTTQKKSSGVFRLSAGTSYSSGDYGDVADTNVFSSTLSAKYSQGPFSLRVSVPFVRLSGPGSLIDTPEGRGGGSSNGSGSGSGGGSGSGRGSEVTPGNPIQTSSGLGDISAALGYSFDLGNDFYLDATGRVKFATASVAKRLGTGKTDVTLGMDATKYFGAVGVYAGVKRRFTGKPVGSSLRDTWGVTVGSSFDASKSATIGIDYDWQQSSIAGNKPISEITGWATVRLSRQLSLNLYASTGLNENSVDEAVGLSLSWRLN